MGRAGANEENHLEEEDGKVIERDGDGGGKVEKKGRLVAGVR